jgi:hypothetical protein
MQTKKCLVVVTHSYNNRSLYFLPGDIKLRPPPIALLRFDRTPPPTFVTLPAVALPAFDILPAPVLFIMLLEEVLVPDFIVELLLASLSKESHQVAWRGPARNEEKNIVNCLLSLMNQGYPEFEIIAVDDTEIR